LTLKTGAALLKFLEIRLTQTNEYEPQKKNLQKHHQKPRITGVSKPLNGVNQGCDGAKPYANTNMKTVKFAFLFHLIF